MLVQVFQLFLLLLVWRAGCTTESTAASDDNRIVKIPLVLKNADQSTTQAEFSFDITEQHARLEFSVAAFCEAYNIRHSFCKQLYNTADERVKDAKEQYLRSTESLNKGSPSSPIQRKINESITLDSQKDDEKPLIRHFASFRSYIQFQQSYLRQIAVNDVAPKEAHAIVTIDNQLNSLRNRIVISRLIFIHSTLFIYQDTSILESMLKRLQSSGVYWDSSLVCVLHYGKPLHRAFRDQFQDVSFIHVSNHTSLFEVPTLRILQNVAMHLNDDELADTHILYMHTLGQSYFSRYDSLDDWREMMLYKLVDEYFKTNFHLLASEAYDIIGLNYERDPRRFHGNFWWASARYIASISPYALDLLHSNFLEIDHFIFQSPQVRVYILHNADIDHHRRRYPPYCYRRLSMATDVKSAAVFQLSVTTNPITGEVKLQPPMFATWSDVCQNIDKYDYLRLHHPEKIPEALYELNNKFGVDIAKCQSLELTSTL